MIVDKRIAAQIAAHFCALDCDDADYLAARAAILDFARTSHRAGDLGLLTEEWELQKRIAELERLKVRIEELEAAGTILRDCFSLHKPNWLIDKDAIKEWDELTKKECE